MVIRIAFLQLLPEEDLAGQLKKGLAACREAKDRGADIALFPEMWSSGYRIPQGADDLEALAVEAEGDFVSAFGALAAELDMAVGVTFLEKHAPRPRNSLVLFDRFGDPRLRYAKVHTCAFDEERVLDPGDGFFVTELDIRGEKVKVGAMICFDREFPESARILMLKGAELILAPNACPMEINRLSALRTRAYENMVAVATCNYPAPHPDCNGRSTLFDGVAWLPEEPGARDMCVMETPEGESVCLGELDLETLRSYRREEIMGWKYRRPETYGRLTAQADELPKEIAPD
jgi:predicted amidohydrolase